MLTAKDIMSTEVKSVPADLEIKELSKLFVQYKYNALPVIDEDGGLVGMVTQTDLVEQDMPMHIPTVVSLFDWVIYLESPNKFSEEVRKVTARKVEEICSREVITCAPEDAVEKVAAMMVENKVHLVPVLDNGRMVGVVGRLDIIRSMGD
jgi:CBS-domain-containing membrane protein